MSTFFLDFFSFKLLLLIILFEFSCRDTVSLFSEKVHQNDEEETDHFENIQSTNWQTMRFKPPPANSEIGWRYALHFTVPKPKGDKN